MSSETTSKKAAETAAKKPAETPGVYVKAVHGELRHLFTNVVFSSDPKKVQMDSFLKAQIDAGKLAIVTP